MIYANPPTDEDFPVPGHKTVRDITGRQLASLGIEMKIAGIGHDKGKAENASLYASHVRKLHSAAGAAAVSAMLAGYSV